MTQSGGQWHQFACHWRLRNTALRERANATACDFSDGPRSISIASAAVASTAAIAAAITTTASASTPASATIFAWARFVDGEGATIVLLAVERGDRCRRFFIRAHLDEAK